VVFYKDPSHSLASTYSTDDDGNKTTYAQHYTEVIRKTIDIIEVNGGTPNSSFNIRYDGEKGDFVYDFNTGDPAVFQRRLELWLKNMSIPESRRSYTPKEMYWYLMDRYGVPFDVAFEEARQVLSVWQQVQMSSYRSYNPVEVAKSVNMDTVAAIEMKSIELDGMQIRESNVRVYPKKTLAAHIIGYMGRMLDEGTIIEMKEVGYTQEDLIGIYGIEATMEYELSANLDSRTGTRVVEVNSRGKIISEVSVTAPKDGNSVVLTIDTGLQKKAEDALEQNIKEIQSVQQSQYNQNKEEYDREIRERGGAPIKFAEVGAAVVMQVQTGEVLALTSYPSFDLNIFTGGLTNEEYAVISEDTRNPLFNKAISSRATPGSIFKMVTAVAGLMEEVITLNTIINDEGLWPVESGEAPSCWVYPHIQEHQNQTIIQGLQNSCNFFFFTVAQGLRIERLHNWASQLGLDSKTNIELTGEVTGQVAIQDSLYNPERAPTGTALAVYYRIKEILKEACDKNKITHDEEVYENAALELMSLATDNQPENGPDIRAILKNDLDLTVTQILNVPYQRYDEQINERLLEITWNSVDTVLTGIGQSVTLVTPIEVVRYVSALVNGGNVYDARLVKSILSPEGEIIEEMRPQLIRQLNIRQEYIDAIRAGMKNVVSMEDGGTAAKYFNDFKYVDQIAGKTGTAQVSQIDLENNAWFVAFAPYEQPEIAVVVYIPNGYSAGYATYTAREIIEYYLDNKTVAEQPPVVPAPNGLTP